MSEEDSGVLTSCDATATAMDTGRRYLRVHLTLPPFPGGMERHVAELTREQRRRGNRVTIAYNFGTSTAPEDLRIAPLLPLHRMRPQVLRDLVFYCAMAVVLWRRRLKADVMHVHGDWSGFLFARLPAWVVGARVRIASVHGNTRRSWWARALYRAVLGQYQVCYATGLTDARYLSMATGRPVAWVTSAIDSSFFRTGPHAPATRGHSASGTWDVATSGSLLPNKNISLVLAIAARLPHRTFAIVGDGPEGAKLMKEAADLGLRNVEFLGEVGRDGVADVLQRSRLFIMTSLVEGTPTAMLEALACALPVVISRSNDYDGILEQGITGFVVEGWTPDQYVAAIESILSDDGAWQRMSTACSARAAELTWAKLASKVDSAVDLALAQGDRWAGE